MKKGLSWATACAAYFMMLSQSASVHAGAIGEELGACMIKNSTDTDRITVVQWQMMILAHHPDIKPFAIISDGDNKMLDQKFDTSMGRLFDSCSSVMGKLNNHSETAIKSEIEVAFLAYYKQAMTEVTDHHDVVKAQKAFGKYGK